MIALSFFVLVAGTKTDLWVSKDQISTKVGKELAHRIVAARHTECSAMSNENIQEKIAEAVNVVSETPKKQQNNQVYYFEVIL